MKIAVFGTGMVGPTVAGALAKLGHDVVVGTRDPQATLARTEAGPMGGVPFAQWHAEHGDIPVGTFAEAAAGSDLVVNATNGTGSLDALTAAGTANLAGKASVAGGDHSVFVSGNDADAKSVVAGLLADLGHRDIIDLGDITTARGTEMLLPIWLRLWGAFGNVDF